jgi:hypothetical protein
MLNPDHNTRRQIADEKWAELHEQMRIARLDGRAARRSRNRRAAQLAQTRQTLGAAPPRENPIEILTAGQGLAEGAVKVADAEAALRAAVED